MKKIAALVSFFFFACVSIAQVVNKTIVFTSIDLPSSSCYIDVDVTPDLEDPAFVIDCADSGFRLFASEWAIEITSGQSYTLPAAWGVCTNSTSSFTLNPVDLSTTSIDISIQTFEGDDGDCEDDADAVDDCIFGPVVLTFDITAGAHNFTIGASTLNEITYHYTVTDILTDIPDQVICDNVSSVDLTQLEPGDYTGGTWSVAAPTNANPLNSPFIYTYPNTHDCLNSVTDLVEYTFKLTPSINSLLDINTCTDQFVDMPIFTGTLGATYTWTNDNTNVGIPTTGSGDIPDYIAPFVTSIETAIITVTPNLNGCMGDPIQFTLTICTSVNLNCGFDPNHPACLDENALIDLFDAWLSEFNYTGGCNPNIISTPPTLPEYSCGTPINLSYDYTVLDNCGSQLICNSSFTVDAATTLNVSCNSIDPNLAVCSSEAEIQNAYVSWLNGFSFTGGCNPNVISTPPVLPTYNCGAPLSLSYDYTVLGDCGNQEFCNSTFTVDGATSLNINCNSFDPNLTACSSESEIQNAYMDWLNGFDYTGGCNVVTNINTIPSLPTFTCNGINLIFTYSIIDDCNPIPFDCTSTFTVVGQDPNDIKCPSGMESYEGCIGDGYSVEVNGNVYDESTPTGIETLIGNTGCDSIVSINLLFNESLSGAEEYEGCNGDGYSVEVNGNVYDESTPLGIETLISSAGCDSIVSINLLFNESFSREEKYEGCKGDGYSIEVNGKVYDESTPLGIETLISSTGCDSVVSIILVFNESLSGEEEYEGCNGDGYSVEVNGNVYDESTPTGIETLMSSTGCDSIVNINLIFIDTVSIDVMKTLCIDEVMIVNGNVYNFSKPTGKEIVEGGSAQGCDSIINVALNFYPEIIASLSEDAMICDGDSIPITFELDGGTIYNVDFFNGTITETLMGITSGHTILVSPSVTTTYSLLSVNALGVPCDPTIQDSSITIYVNDISATAQIVSDYNGFNIACQGGSDGAINALVEDGVAPYIYKWSNGHNSKEIEGLLAGTYIITVTDEEGCSAVAMVQLTEPEGIEINVEGVTPTCYGEDDGLIIIDTIIGGNAPYSYSLEGSMYEALGNSFPVTIANLASGMYDLQIQGLNGCNTSTSVNIASLPPLTIELGDDIEINLGDSVELIPLTNTYVEDFVWNTTIYMSCDTCFQTFATPTNTQYYEILVIDSFGCSAMDNITIVVLKPKRVFIPNVFSPNGDGINDLFLIYAGDEVVNIKSLRIYDRWGEQVFARENFKANDPLLGWDGYFRSQIVNPGVFAFWTEIEFVDGIVKIYIGDLTILK